METKFQSTEELYFSYYLAELSMEGLILSWAYEPKTFILSEKAELSYKGPRMKESKSSTLLQPHSYTPDFVIHWSLDALDKLVTGQTKPLPKYPFCYSRIPLSLEEKPLYTYDKVPLTYVEVKPEFDKNNMTRLARTNIKWVLDKHNIYIQLVKPFSLFQKTFTPKRVVELEVYKRDNAKRGISKGDSKLKYEPVSITEYLNSFT